MDKYAKKYKEATQEHGQETDAKKCTAVDTDFWPVLLKDYLKVQEKQATTERLYQVRGMKLRSSRNACFKSYGVTPAPDTQPGMEKWANANLKGDELTIALDAIPSIAAWHASTVSL